MDSTTLLRLLKQSIDPERCSVAGVFPRDHLTIDMFPKFPGCCIANIDDSNKPGKHWVAYYVRGPNDYDFFDSYGLTPSHYAFALNSPTDLNTRSLQSDLSNTCGHFCLYFLHCKTLGFAMSNVLNSFSPIDLKWNDKLVRKFVSKVSNAPSFVHSALLLKPVSQVSLPKSFKRLLY